MSITITSPANVTGSNSANITWDQLLIRQSVLDSTNGNYLRNWQINNGVLVLTKGAYIAGFTLEQLAPLLVVLVPQLSWPPVITVQPVSASVAHTNPQTFSITATTEVSSITYQWQLSTNSGGTWANQGNGGVYSNMTTATMTITPSTVSPYNGYQFRCVATNASGSTTSSAATLTVT